jgi:hypothetical protein
MDTVGVRLAITQEGNGEHGSQYECSVQSKETFAHRSLQFRALLFIYWDVDSHKVS